jgi:hypothetical protein
MIAHLGDGGGGEGGDGGGGLGGGGLVPGPQRRCQKAVAIVCLHVRHMAANGSSLTSAVQSALHTWVAAAAGRVAMAAAGWERVGWES